MVTKLLSLVEVVELAQRLIFDLTDALARDFERASDIVECARLLAVEAVAQLEHAPLAVGEILDRCAQRLVGEDLRGALVGRDGLFVCDQLAELEILVVADGLLERDRRLSRSA